MTEISTSLQAYQCLRAQLNPHAEEVWVLALNSQLRLIKMEMIFRGTVDHCLIHPREVFRFLVLCNASSFVLGHNHPSEDPRPSDQDLILTRRIVQLSKMAEIPLNDHIIFTTENYFSMGDHGFLKKWRKRNY